MKKNNKKRTLKIEEVKTSKNKINMANAILLTLISMLLLLLTVFLNLVLEDQRKEKYFPPRQTEKIETTEEKQEPAYNKYFDPMAQRQFAYGKLIKILDDIAKRYPIEELRDIFYSILARNLKGELTLEMSQALPKIKVEPFAGFICKERSDSGKDTLALYVPSIMKAYDNDDIETFKDRLVLAFLHEQYHNDHHCPCGDDDPVEIKAHNEAEAWWYECDQVLRPMREAGRAKNINQKAWEFFIQANGDINSPVWQSFARIATGQ